MASRAARPASALRSDARRTATSLADRGGVAGRLSRAGGGKGAGVVRVTRFPHRQSEASVHSGWELLEPTIGAAGGRGQSTTPAPLPPPALAANSSEGGRVE